MGARARYRYQFKVYGGLVMYEVGDIVLCGTTVGVVIKVTEKTLTCSTCYASDKEFAISECSLIAGYADVLEQFERSILNACR